MDGFKNIEIKNFRGIDHLKIDDFSRVNVFLGQNTPWRISPSLTTPAKKTKIYGYLEALLGTSKREKELIKEKERNYKNTQHWNLDAEYLEPLREFLNNNLL